MSLKFNEMADDLKTPELCLAAVQKNGMALEYVPEQLKVYIKSQLTRKVSIL